MTAEGGLLIGCITCCTAGRVRLAMSKQRANDEADGDPNFPRRSMTQEPKATQRIQNFL
jgi:hypothetical protein